MICISKILLNPNYGLYEKDGQAFCDSLQIAETFEKRHDHVLRDIEQRLEDVSKSNTPNFGEINFIKSTYKDDKNRKYPKYLLTKDGFSFLAMGFTGKKATNFKLAYINRFNEMEQFIKSLQETKIEFPAFTDAIMEAHEEPKHYHYSTEINMIYRIVLGMDAKKFRELRGLEKGTIIKPYLSEQEVKAIELLQRTDIGLLEMNADYETRKEVLTSKYNRNKLRLLA